MPTEPKPSVHSPNFTLAELQLSIRNDEAVGLSLKSIDVAYLDDGASEEKALWTIAKYKRKWEGADSLHLQADTSAGIPPSEGTTLICRGVAMISGTQTPVVAFRSA
jgi:hypothetical protein